MADKTGRITFIIGGAKSGKSAFALEKAGALSGRKAYIATAEAGDSEMEEKIEKHKISRGPEWQTFETPLDLTERIKEISSQYDSVVIDCLTLWLSNLMLDDRDIEKDMEFLVSSLRDARCSLFVVSNEVGMGIVPDNTLSRTFRELAGKLNQELARISDEVYLVTAGIPIRIKP